MQIVTLISSVLFGILCLRCLLSFIADHLRPRTAPNRMFAACNSCLSPCPEALLCRSRNTFTEHYELEEEVMNNGQFSKIHRCQQKSTWISAAVKIFDTTKQNKNERLRMEREIKIVAYLRKFAAGCGVVKFMEYMHFGSTHYVVFELLIGFHLLDEIYNRRAHSESAAAKYINQILTAVAFCHQNGIIHRDIRPENLLLDDRGRHANVKLIDFGYAVKYRRNGNTGIVGWPDNRAPEMGPEICYGFEVDMWACGVVLYNLLTGTAPFKENDGQTLAERIQAANYETEPLKWDGLSDDAKNLIDALLKADPRERLTAQAAIQSPFVDRQFSGAPQYKKHLVNALIQMTIFTQERWVRAAEYREQRTTEVIESELPSSRERMPLVQCQEPTPVHSEAFEDYLLPEDVYDFATIATSNKETGATNAASYGVITKEPRSLSMPGYADIQSSTHAEDNVKQDESFNEISPVESAASAAQHGISTVSGQVVDSEEVTAVASVHSNLKLPESREMGDSQREEAHTDSEAFTQ